MDFIICKVGLFGKIGHGEYCFLLDTLEYKEEYKVNESKKQKQRSHLRLYLFEFRKKAGLSIYEMTTKLLISKPYYYQIEQGIKGHRMDVILINDLANILKVDFQTLCQCELEYQLERRELGLRSEGRWVIDYEIRH